MTEVEEYEKARQREELREIVSNVMDVSTVQHVPPEERGAIRASGQLRQDADTAYAYLSERLRPLGYTPLLQHDDQDGAAVLAMPGLVMQRPSRLWLAVLLFLLTVASTIFAQGLEPAPGGGISLNIGLGLAFSASLLSILLAHELGHFIVARRLGVNVSYPFFIPMPLTPIGTMGAVISMKEPPPHRRALLSIAIAGPLAGLVVAVPVLLLGLSLSEVRNVAEMEAEARTMAEQAGNPTAAYLLEGNSLLYIGAKYLVFGKFLPGGGEDVLLHPVAWAGWVGLLVTALNLIPAGQLDGGHIFYALVGPRIARMTTAAIVVILAALGFLWVGWFLWAALIFFFGQYRAPLLNEITPLDSRNKALAVLGIIIFVLVFIPIPLQVIEIPLTPTEVGLGW